MVKIDIEFPDSCDECLFYLTEKINDMGALITYYRCQLDYIPFEDYAYGGKKLKNKRHKNCELINDNKEGNNNG